MSYNIVTVNYSDKLNKDREENVCQNNCNNAKKSAKHIQIHIQIHDIYTYF